MSSIVPSLEKTMIRHHTTYVLALAAATTAMLAGCSLPHAALDNEIAEADNYSITQTVINDSNLDLTVQSVTVDNDGTVVAGYPSVVRAKTQGIFQATNTGNGVQLWVRLSAANGQTVTVDTDLPRKEGTWGTGTVAGPGTGAVGSLAAGAISVGSGKAITASFTVNSCSSDWNCPTKAAYPDTPVAARTGS